MPAAESIIKKYWTYLLAATTVCVWLIRLEGKVDYIEKIQDTEGKRMATAIEKMAATQDRMSEQISEMRSALSGVVGYEKGAHDARSKRGSR